MLNLISNWRIILAIASIGGALIWGVYNGKQQYDSGYTASDVKWQAEVSKIKAESATKLAQEISKTREIEQEAQRAANTATSGLLANSARAISDRDAALAALAERLRNNPTRCGAGGGSATPSDNSTGATETASGGLWISGQGAADLIDLATKADQLHAQYVAIQSYLKLIGM